MTFFDRIFRRNRIELNPGDVVEVWSEDFKIKRGEATVHDVDVESVWFVDKLPEGTIPGDLIKLKGE